MVAFWWIFSIMLTATFSGNLIAELTVPRVNMPFNSLAEMVQQTDYGWGISKGTVLEEFLRETDYFPFGELSRGVQHSEEGQYVQLQRVLDGGYAYVGDKSGLEYLAEKYCNLAFVRDEFLAMEYAMAFHKGSPYTAVFSKKLRQFSQGGLIKQWKKRWWPTQNCSEWSSSRGKRMNMMDVQSAFYLLVIGIVVGGLSLTWEHIITKYLLSKARTAEKAEIERVEQEMVSTGKVPKDVSNEEKPIVNTTLAI